MYVNRCRVRLAAALIAFVLGGCGGTTDEAAPKSQSEPDAASTDDGRVLFADRCSACHTLSDAKANGRVGPNLDALRPEAQRVASKVRNGGGGMPAFEGQLSDSEVRAVADYVAQVAGG